MKIELKTDVLVLEADMNGFAYSNDCPFDLRSRLTAIPASERINRGAQVLYAHYDLLNEIGKNACGQLFCYAVNMGWSAFNAQHQSAAIVERIEADLSGDAAKDFGDWPVPQVVYREGHKDWRVPDEEVVTPTAPPAKGE